jgi:hypothetical protein
MPRISVDSAKEFVAQAELPRLPRAIRRSVSVRTSGEGKCGESIAGSFRAS